MLGVQLTLVSIAGLISIAFGIRYFLAREYMPYHAVVAGRPWAGLEPGLRTIILGMLKILAGGFMTYGVALLWLLIPLNRGERWAAWAAITLTLATVLPTLYVTIALRRAAPAARTPIVPALVVLLLALAGAGLSFLP